MDWGFRVERDGTITPDAGLTEGQLRVLEAKLKVALAQVQLLIVEKGVRLRLQVSLTNSDVAREEGKVERTPSANRTLLRVPEVAETLGVSTSRCYELLRSGQIPSIRLGKSIRVSRAALESWLEDRSDSERGNVW